MTGRVEHLYVHVPFCAHRCGYCDFVTAVGRREEHAPYVEALLVELALERELLAPELKTVFVGGGTPTFTESRALARLLESLPAATEVTVEANPETVTAELGRLLRRHGVNRVSLGVQSFRPHLLRTLERRAGPDDVRRAVYHLRDASFDNISFDLIYGIPGQSASDLDRDLSEALALEPEHLSCYELEAKRGTRFTYAHGQELAAQAERMEAYYERVVETLTTASYRWYETANFCRSEARDLRARHNLAYWSGSDYLGIGLGAVSTVGGRRSRNTARLSLYTGPLMRGARPAREVEALPEAVRRRERVMLGLRLDEPLPLAGVRGALDDAALARLERGGLLTRAPADGAAVDEAISLTARGRFLAGGVAAELIA